MSQLRNSILCGDALDLMPALPDNSIDAVVTDPPYGLRFMGKKWDYDVPSVAVWREVLRVLKPGGHLLSFGGSRTYHRMVVAIEDAGFKIRDQIMWIYGSGFPKSLNIGLCMDKLEGHPDRGHRIAVANRHHPDGTLEPNGEILPAYEPKTENGKRWQGFGTALKPAHEPICLARKPLIGTVVENVLKHGTGGLNIDGCRIEGEGWDRSQKSGDMIPHLIYGDRKRLLNQQSSLAGRFPANIIHDGSEEATAGMPDTSRFDTRNTKICRTARSQAGNPENHWGYAKQDMPNYPNEIGSAARYFYCAKASKEDRDEGLEGFTAISDNVGCYGNGLGNAPKVNGIKYTPICNLHPTVKPTALMRYLCRLITPPGGVILDPYAGSGSTGKAAVLEGFSYILIESEAEYCRIAQARIDAVERQARLFKT